MARLRPSLDDLDQLLRPLTEADIEVGRALARLDDDWTVYLQPRLGQDEPDFVVVHPLAGVCVIHVKDWRPGDHRRNDDGAIQRRDNLGAWHRSTARPRWVADRSRSTIFDQFFALPSDGTETTEAVRAIVALPHFTDAEAVDLLSHPTLGERERKIAVWGGDGLARDIEQVVRGIGCAHPRPESIQRLAEHIVASEVPGQVPPPKPLSSGARLIEQNPSGAHVRRVRGPAGSGKSFAVAARAARLAAEGKRVLVLSYSVTFANRLMGLAAARCRELGTNPTRITCANFHSFCTRVVQDAEQLGLELTAPRGRSWPDVIVAKATQAFEAGFERRYDAVLVDEGQDFTIDFWNLLRRHAVGPEGEMLLAVDPAQDLYGRRAWTDEAQMLAAGFRGPWIELEGTYRLPGDVVPLVDDFAAAHLDGDRGVGDVAPDRADVSSAPTGSIRRWHNVDAVGDLGIEIGREVVRMLRDHPSLSPRDVVFLCDYHHDGVAAVAEIESAGYPVHHIFSRNPDDARRRRKYRFWPAAEAVKGCTVHSFKGWETTALVVGIGVETRSKRNAYVAMTRIAASPAGPASLSVVNADKRIAAFRAAFEAWAAPRPELRVH